VLRALFSGSRFIFWSLGPILVLFALSFPFLIVTWSGTTVAIVVVLDAVALLLAIGLYNPRRNEWALRMITGLVFVAYLAYVVAEVRAGKPLLLTGSHGEESLRNALLGLVLIGWPCIKFTFSGFDGWKQADENRADSSDLRSPQP
jgi:hypothetical protein